jgi:hypothetical protein
MELLMTDRLTILPDNKKTTLEVGDYVFVNTERCDGFDVDGWLPFDLVMFANTLEPLHLTDLLGTTGVNCVMESGVC